MFEFPGFDPVALHVGPLAIRWYGLMYVVGFVGGWWLARRRALRADSPMTPEQVDDLVTWIALGVIIGGRVGSVLFYNFDNFLLDPLSLFRIWEGGMSFHGGFIGVMIAGAWFARRIGCSFMRLMDFIAPMVPIGLGAGRIGNFINSELWGKVTDVPWAVIVDGQPRHASQLYEAFLEGLVMFVVLWTFSAKPRPTMAVSGMFLICYGLFRSGVEFVRMPDSNIGYLVGGWFTMGQLLSLPMLIVGIVLITLAYRRRATADVAH